MNTEFVADSSPPCAVPARAGCSTRRWLSAAPASAHAGAPSRPLDDRAVLRRAAPGQRGRDAVPRHEARDLAWVAHRAGIGRRTLEGCAPAVGTWISIGRSSTARRTTCGCCSTTMRCTRATGAYRTGPVSHGGSPVTLPVRPVSGARPPGRRTGCRRRRPHGARCPRPGGVPRRGRGGRRPGPSSPAPLLRPLGLGEPADRALEVGPHPLGARFRFARDCTSHAGGSCSIRSSSASLTCDGIPWRAAISRGMSSRTRRHVGEHPPRVGRRARRATHAAGRGVDRTGGSGGGAGRSPAAPRRSRPPRADACGGVDGRGTSGIARARRRGLRPSGNPTPPRRTSPTAAPRTPAWTAAASPGRWSRSGDEESQPPEHPRDGQPDEPLGRGPSTADRPLRSGDDLVPVLGRHLGRPSRELAVDALLPAASPPVSPRAARDPSRPPERTARRGIPRRRRGGPRREVRTPDRSTATPRARPRPRGTHDDHGRRAAHTVRRRSLPASTTSARRERTTRHPTTKHRHAWDDLVPTRNMRTARVVQVFSRNSQRSRRGRRSGVTPDCGSRAHRGLRPHTALQCPTVHNDQHCKGLPMSFSASSSSASSPAPSPSDPPRPSGRRLARHPRARRDRRPHRRLDRRRGLQRRYDGFFSIQSLDHRDPRRPSSSVIWGFITGRRGSRA